MKPALIARSLLPCAVLFAALASTQETNPERTYIIHVLAAEARTPVPNASVQVELEDAAKTTRKGRTSADGIFRFTWRPTQKLVRARISVHAKGFTDTDDIAPLIEERIIQIEKDQ